MTGGHREAQSSTVPILAFQDKSLNAWPNLHLARDARNKRKDFKYVNCHNKYHLHFFCTLVAQSNSTRTVPSRASPAFCQAQRVLGGAPIINSLPCARLSARRWRRCARPERLSGVACCLLPTDRSSQRPIMGAARQNRGSIRRRRGQPIALRNSFQVVQVQREAA
jgi:hypothetical protein